MTVTGDPGTERVTDTEGRPARRLRPGTTGVGDDRGSRTVSRLRQTLGVDNDPTHFVDPTHAPGVYPRL